MESDLRFEWDDRKEAANRLKHRVSFAEAMTAFTDESGLVIDDPDHSDEERRFVLLGMSAARRLLVVVHAEREDGAVLRIISARRATRRESAWYDPRPSP